MLNDRAFFQAIRETPEDDAPRLIYADWLEEQGGAERTARAAFIRAQCRLAALPEDAAARDILEDEAAELLAEYERDWTEPLHGIAEDWRFSRGFIEHLRIRGDNLLTQADHLFDFAPLRSLHLLIHPRDVPHLLACTQFQWIETLDFSGCHLNDRALQQLLTSPYLGRLRALHLSGNGINTPGIHALVRSPLFRSLRSLDLSRNIAIGDTATRLLTRTQQAENLEVLNLANTNLTLDGVLDLLQSAYLPSLRDLNLSGARVSMAQQTFSSHNPPEMKVLAQLRSLDLSESRASFMLSIFLHSLSSTNLHSLSLRNITADAKAAELIARSSSLANLTALDLRHNRLDGGGVHILADSRHLTSLRCLNVGFNNIRDTGAKAIAESPHLRCLRTLDLAGNGIGGPGLLALAESVNLDYLHTLNVGKNFIGPDSVRALTDSPHLRHLRHLDFGDAYLEEECGRILAAAPNMERLRTLRLAKNLLGDGGAKALAQSPYLKRLILLDLNDNRIGKAGAEALALASWRRMQQLDVRGNVFTDTQENLLRSRFGEAVML